MYWRSIALQPLAVLLRISTKNERGLDMRAVVFVLLVMTSQFAFGAPGEMVIDDNASTGQFAVVASSEITIDDNASKKPDNAAEKSGCGDLILEALECLVQSPPCDADDWGAIFEEMADECD